DARRIPVELVEGFAQQTLRSEHSIAHVRQRVGVRLAEVVEVVRETLGALAHRLDRGDREAVTTTFLTEEPEVLLTVRRHLTQHRDAPVPLPLEPRRHQRSVATDIAVSEPEAILTLHTLRARPTDERHLQLVRQPRDGD